MKDENGPLIALVIFIVLSLVFGAFAYQAHGELVGDESRKAKAKEIEEHEDTIRDLQKQIDKRKRDIALNTQIIQDQQAIYDFHAARLNDYMNEVKRRQVLVEAAEKFQQQAVEITDSISKLKNETVQRLTQETTAVRNDMESELQERNTAKENATLRKGQLTTEFDVEKKRHQANKNYNQTELDNTKSILTDLTQRDIERADIFNQPDGEIILADQISNTIVINIGTAAGVKNGFRFEVYHQKPDKSRIRKGFIEVRTASVSQSECFIVRKPLTLPRDPLSQYTAQDPEESFSPYHESGKQGSTAQPLSGRGKQTTTGPDQTNPIVEGDKIENPFYAPNKSFTFYIAGAKKIENDRQKSAIRYRWTEIKNVIEAYGGKVSPVADATVDYVIAQKNPDTEGEDAERAEFRKAKDLGLPVIYEWELFRFLDNK